MYSLAEDHVEDLAMNLVFADPGRSGGTDWKTVSSACQPRQRAGKWLFQGRPKCGYQKKGSGPGKSRSKQQSATAGCPGTPAEAGSRWTGNPEGVYVTIATSTLVWITGDNFR